MKIVSLSAELAVLRALTSKDPRMVGEIIATTDSSYFHSVESVEIYETVRKLFLTSGEPPSYRLVIQDPELSEDARQHFRDSQALVKTIEDSRRAVKILNKYRQTRGLYNLAGLIAERLKGRKINLEGVLDEVATHFVQIRARKTSSENYLHIGVNNNSDDFVRSVIHDSAEESVIPTGIEAFDSVSGGFIRGSCVTLGGTSGGGKSMVANALAMYQASCGYRVTIVPLEMSKREQVCRILASLSGIDVTRILINKITDNEKALIEHKWRRWKIRVKKRGGRLSLFKPDEDVTLDETFAAMASYPCDVGYYDYVTLFKGASEDDQWRILGNMGRSAKINAEVTNRVNVLLCQVSEDLKIRYARALSEHSTNSWLWATPKEEREKEMGIIQLEQPKSRNGASFPIRIGMHWAHMKVVNLKDGGEHEQPDTTKDQPKKRKDLPNLATQPDV